MAIGGSPVRAAGSPRRDGGADSVRTADVAIVGGGLMGVWTAYFLARRGARVAVLDKGLVGAQASGVNFGNLRLQDATRGNIRWRFAPMRSGK